MRRAVFEITLKVSLPVVLLLLSFGVLNEVAIGSTVKDVAGTYTNLAFNKEGGDLLGVEIRIVPTKKGYEGVLQFAEGGPEELILVEIQVENKSIRFSIPDSDPNAGSFSGVIENGVLKGHFQYKSGGAEDVVLKKGKSYWD